MRGQAAIGLAAAVLALGAFAFLACAGLAIIPRYTMLAAAVLAVFAALALLGWRLLEPGHPWRRAWQAFAAVVALMFVAWGPNQYDLLSRVDTDLTNQGEIESDLGDLAGSGAFEPLCLPISVPNHRAVPRLAFDLDLRPSRIVSSSEQRQPRRGYFLDPASPFVIHNFILDPNDPSRFTDHGPPRLPPRRPQRLLAPLPPLLTARGWHRGHRAAWPSPAARGAARRRVGQSRVAQADTAGGSSTCRSTLIARVRGRAPQPRSSAWRGRGRRACGPRR